MGSREGSRDKGETLGAFREKKKETVAGELDVSCKSLRLLTCLCVFTLSNEKVVIPRNWIGSLHFQCGAPHHLLSFSCYILQAYFIFISLPESRQCTLLQLYNGLAALQCLPKSQFSQAYNWHYTIILSHGPLKYLQLRAVYLAKFTYTSLLFILVTKFLLSLCYWAPGHSGNYHMWA